MSTGLKTHYIDFEIIPTSNPKTIVFVDSSEYYKQPESPMLKVFPPGSSKYFAVNINAGRVNTFNSNTLGYTSVLKGDCPIDFADGIWEFTYTICPYKYFYKTKYYLRTTHIDASLSKIYSKLDLSDIFAREDKATKRELIDITILLESAKANAELGNIDKANKELSLAQIKVGKLINCIRE